MTAELWAMADALRGAMDAAEYKHVVLGLIFLKYISDAFEERHAQLVAEQAQGADPEDPDEYRAENIFWVPPEARWTHLQAQAKQPTIGQLIDDAMSGIERDNPALKDVLPKDYARPALDKRRLGQLIDMVSNIMVGRRGRPLEGCARPRLRVLPVAVRERRGQEGRRVLHAPLRRQVAGRDAGALSSGRVYDPCCGSSGMFVQSVDFIDAHATRATATAARRAATSRSGARSRTTPLGGSRR